MKNKKSKKSILFLPSIGALTGIVAPMLVAASCSHELPELSISEDPKLTYVNDNGERIIKGSAKAFYKLNSQNVFNPISTHDSKYKLYTPDGKLNNAHDSEHIYKIKPNFDFLVFKNLTGPHDYRLFSFRYDELVTNLPGVARRAKYSQYQYNPKAVFVMLYWIKKTAEAAPNFENDIISPSRSRFPYAGPSIEEAPWPFVRNISNSLKGFWQDVIEPLVLIFDKE
ncbi:hypothetical protein [Mycoplasmopsis arginini]|uniref:Lipoprotein n=1 Tax=Mycoplasmopsis arginini TaxID=2094 RepID=A0AA43TZG5_MYCAR|nr:hypothetical protein [Mycoplasmopsis arginini]MDI3349345.1 hypothetical protein [Mycoplasmopsis arginini]